MVVTFSHGGYVKSQPLTDYRAQRRGGRGRMATAMKEDDFIERLFVAHSHDHLLSFSNRGRLYWLKVYEVPAGSRSSRGKPIVNMFPLEEGEKITAVVPVKEFDENHYVFMATAQGTVKKTPLADFAAAAERHHRGRPGRGRLPRRCRAHRRQVRRHAFLLGRQGGALPGRRRTADGPPGDRGARHAPRRRTARRVALAAKDESRAVLTATANGYGKRTAMAEYPRHGRGGQGVIAIQVSERNGAVIGSVLVVEQDEVMLISTGGVLIRTAVSQIREMGRSTQGVTLISLDQGKSSPASSASRSAISPTATAAPTVTAAMATRTKKFLRRPNRRRPSTEVAHLPLCRAFITSARVPRCCPPRCSRARR